VCLFVSVLAWTLEDAGSRCTFCADTVAKLDVNGRVSARWVWAHRTKFQGRRRCCPSPGERLCTCLQAIKRGPVVEIKDNEGLAKKFGSLMN
jgi:hypothetical protein